MAKIERFEDIEGWKSGREVARLVYGASRRDPFCKDFALCNQMRRAVVSIISNIAEGFGRDGNKEFVQFLAMAKGSCGEVRSQLYIALDQQYIDEGTFKTINEKLIDTSRLISGFKRYLQGSEFRGGKFQ